MSGEKNKIVGVFEQGKQGAICKHPSDRSVWIAPERGVDVRLGVSYYLEITGIAKSGRLRFARVLETVVDANERILNEIKAAINDENNLEVTYVALGKKKLIIKLPDDKSVTLYWDRLGTGHGYRHGFMYEGCIIKSEAITRVWDRAVRQFELDEEQKKQKNREERKVQVDKDAKRRAETVIEDSAKVEQFFQEYPDAINWFESLKKRVYQSAEETKLYQERLEEMLQEKGIALDITWNEVLLEAVERKIAQATGPSRRVGGLSYKHQFFEQSFSMPLGGKDIAFTLTRDDDEYDG